MKTNNRLNHGYQEPATPGSAGTPPIIIDPTPSRPSLPLMNTFEDAAQLNVQERTTFYVSAFMFQCWISELANANRAQLAEKADPNDRSFQSGQAWRGFLKHFGKARGAEFPTLFGHLMQFGEYDDPFAEHIMEAFFPIHLEHELTGQFLGRRTLIKLRNRTKQMLALKRVTVHRLCDWLDSALQLRVLQEWHLLPDAFDPDPQKRELACLGRNQCYFDHMNQHSQAHWLNHMADAVEEFKNSPKWAAFHQASAVPLPEPRPWPTHALDATLIRLWPLATHYRWSAPDLLHVLHQVLNPASLAPCPDEAALVAYCAATLSLRCASLKSHHRHAPEPPAASVALRLCAPEPPTPSAA